MSRQAEELRDWQDWTDPDFFTVGRQSESRLLPLFLRQLRPSRVERTKLTLTGWILILVAMGIGSAAYNTASNILFMTLSLLLSSLILSGILSLINFKKLRWELVVPSRLQVGEVGAAEIKLTNAKTIFPSMSLAFRVGHSGTNNAESIYLPHALRVGGSARLEWTFTPDRRGRCEILLDGAESKFPFGFIRKTVGATQRESVLVWPARVAYQFREQAEGRNRNQGFSRLRIGQGSDLLKIREYQAGDPPRLIHWKATARSRRLMVRELAQEGAEGYHLFLDPDASLWRGERFESLCSLAGSLAEDLLHAGRLQSIRVGAAEAIFIRGLRELYGFFDTLAELVPGKGAPAGAARNQITFRPSGETGIAIYVDGVQTGQIED